MVTVLGLQVIATAGQAAFYLLCSSVNVGDVLSPQRVAGVALPAGREVGIISRSTLITENTGDSDPTDALASFRVTRGTLGSLHVAVTS